MSLAKKYLNMYLAQFFSIILNLISVVVVMPRLSSFPEYLGIYTLGSSLLSYMAYGDFGFLSAATKYATESYAKNDNRELDFIGFSLAILLGACAIFILSMIGYSLFYNMVKLKNQSKEIISFFNFIMLVLIIFSPVFVLRRVVQIFYSIRFEDYYLRFFFGLGSLLKIVFSFILVKDNPFGVGYYFLCGNIIDLITVAVCFLFAFKRYSFSFRTFLAKIKINRDIYDQTKKLAFASLISTFGWILFFELDSIFLATFGSLTQIGLMSGCLMLVGYIRTIMGIFFSPFSVRFNYFTGVGDFVGLKKICIDLMNFSFPFIVFFILTITYLITPLLRSWLGPSYLEASLCTSFYILAFVFSFVQYPGSMLIVSLERNKEIIFLSFLIAVIYWFLMAFFFSKIGILAIGLFKFFGFFFMYIFYLYKIVKYTQASIRNILIQHFVLGGGVAVCLWLLNGLIVKNFLSNISKSYTNVFLVILLGAFYFLFSTLTYYFISVQFRDLAKRIYQITKNSVLKGA